jgi:rRNA-processing protein FCF1
MVLGSLTGMQEVFLVSDANVLIDYHKANKKLIRILCSEYRVLIPKVIMDEIEDFSEEEAIHAGFHRVNSKTYHKTKPIGGEVI